METLEQTIKAKSLERVEANIAKLEQSLAEQPNNSKLKLWLIMQQVAKSKLEN